jgi:hypothetical protein
MNEWMGGQKNTFFPLGSSAQWKKLLFPVTNAGLLNTNFAGVNVQKT